MVPSHRHLLIACGLSALIAAGASLPVARGVRGASADGTSANSDSANSDSAPPTGVAELPAATMLYTVNNLGYTSTCG